MHNSNSQKSIEMGENCLFQQIIITKVNIYSVPFISRTLSLFDLTLLLAWKKQQQENEVFTPIQNFALLISLLKMSVKCIFRVHKNAYDNSLHKHTNSKEMKEKTFSMLFREIKFSFHCWENSRKAPNRIMREGKCNSLQCALENLHSLIHVYELVFLRRILIRTFYQQKQ